MTGLPVTLTQLAHLLPPDSRGQLELLDDLCPGIVCLVSGEGGEPRFALEVQVGSRTVRTGGHRHVGPGLVEDLTQLLEAHLGRMV